MSAGGADLGSKEYRAEAERLAKLPRAERFEELIDFPTRHLFKVIGRGEGLTEAIRRTLSSLDCAEIIPVERYSKNGRYLSITFQLRVESGAQLDSIYTALEQLPGVVYLF